MYFVGRKKLVSFDFLKTQFDLSKWTKAFKKNYSNPFFVKLSMS